MGISLLNTNYTSRRYSVDEVSALPVPIGCVVTELRREINNGGIKMSKGGFSWKRATGVTNAKRKISKATGIPLTKQGRRNKTARAMTGGCLTLILAELLIAACIVFFIVEVI
ncbi:MAG: hypothetical protein IKQ36_04430 [Clostridia bacterium]|nr:hypothetical protein [Clostridia bacterium]